jgi:hypothetical protein
MAMDYARPASVSEIAAGGAPRADVCRFMSTPGSTVSGQGIDGSIRARQEWLAALPIDLG